MAPSKSDLALSAAHIWLMGLDSDEYDHICNLVDEYGTAVRHVSRAMQTTRAAASPQTAAQRLD